MTFKGNEKVQFMAIQTVFEGFQVNTQNKVRKNQLKYNLKIPMAHAAGNPNTHRVPEIMQKYRSGGTPWKVIIDPSGKVVYNNFHIDIDQAVSLIKALLREQD